MKDNPDSDVFSVKIEENKSEFVRSVEEFTTEKTKKKKCKKKLASKLIYLFIMALCLVVLVWGVLTVIKSAGEYIKGKRLYSDLSDYFSGNSEMPSAIADMPDRYSKQDTASTASISLSEIRSLNLENIKINVSDTESEGAKYRAKFDALKLINPDIYGWISIENSEVDYPIVRGNDNAYYLDHAYTGEYMIVGSIFADYRTNDKIINNYNTVLYGHNMENGTMFHIVELMYEDEELFDKTKINVYTADGIYTYAPISVYETNAYDQYFRMRFASITEFTDFLNSLLEKSAYKREAEFTENERILTLSTCTNEAFSGRYALHARLIDVKEFDE